jgi:hypothetical protein
VSAPALTRGRLTGLLVLVAVIGGAAFATNAGETGGSDPSGVIASPSGSPTTSATPTVEPEEFCDAFKALATARGDMLDGEPSSGAVDVKAAAQEVADLAGGTRMPSSARAGIDFVTGSLLAIEDDATADELLAAGTSYTLDDSSNADALVRWLDRTC